MVFMQVAILLAVVLALAYLRAIIWCWTFCIGFVLLLLTLFSSIGFISITLCWLIYIAAVLFATVKTLRISYFTKPLIKILEQRMPSISVTEREAIHAGDVWWERDLFCGRPRWKKMLSNPPPKLNEEEEKFLANQVETLCAMLDDWQIVNNDHDLPPSVWQYLKDEKFFGMIIPKKYGGHGFSALAHSSIVVKIATRSLSAAVNTMVPNSLGPAEMLLNYGTEQQKNDYLPRLASGEEIPCFALTAPEAGSDASSIIDKGIVCRGQFEGKEVLGIRLTWDKRYITLAPVATLLGLVVHLYDPERLLGVKNDIGITLCLIPTTHPGVEIGNRHLPLHLAFMNGPTRGKDVFIPIDWIIGGVEMAGQGWRMLMECLSIGRSISLPALSTACGKLAYRMTGAYAGIRKQFNTAIANFEGIEEALGEMAGLTYTLEACRMMTAGAVDQHIRPSIVSAIAKYHMTEMARRVMNHAMDVHGGHMIQAGPRNYLAHGYMALPVSITVEGANILTRNLIIFGQGAIRCHPYILREIELLTANDENKVKKLDKLLLSHIGYVISNVVRNLFCGLTGGKLLISPVSGYTAPYYRQLTRMSAALALLSDTSMILLGGGLKRRERISARLGDMLSELYLASCVLKYDQDNHKQAHDMSYVRWSVEMCLYRLQIACHELLQNFPNKLLGKLLKWLIFPYGLAYQKPRDELYHTIVSYMLSPSDFRDRLTKYCYLGQKQDATYRLEEALALRVKLDPILKKFQVALRSGLIENNRDTEESLQSALEIGVLTQNEVNVLREYYILEKDVIQVNEFSFDLKSVIS